MRHDYCICPWKQFHAGTKFLAENSNCRPRKREYKFYIHNDRYGTNELPESGLSKWLKERWIEKMGRLEMLRDKLAVERNGKRRTCYVNEARKVKSPPTHDKLESARRSLAINC